MVRCYTFIVLVGFVTSACAQVAPPPEGGDANRRFEAACVGAQVRSGNIAGAQACLDLGQRLRGRAAQTNETQSRIPCGTHIAPERWAGGQHAALKISGPITPGCEQKLLATIREIISKYPGSPGIVTLDSQGGSLRAASMYARLFNQDNWAVVVGPHARCASACFLIFAAIKNKAAARTAHIGVHSAFDRVTGTETIGSKAVTAEVARTLSDVGVPDAIVGRMVTTRPDEVAWLSIDELNSMGVKIFD